MHPPRTIAAAALMGLTLATAGCSALPSAGPTANQVLDEGNREKEQVPRYSSPSSTSAPSRSSRIVPSPPWLAAMAEGASDPSTAIGVGDTVQATIWEAASGGLFSSAAIGSITAS